MVAVVTPRTCKKCFKEKQYDDFNARNKSTCIECQRVYARQRRKLAKIKWRLNKYGVNGMHWLGLDKEGQSPVMEVCGRPSHSFLGKCDVVAQQGNVLIAQRSDLPRFCALLLIVSMKARKKDRRKKQFFQSYEDQEKAALELVGKQVNVESFTFNWHAKRDLDCEVTIGDSIYKAYCDFVWPKDLTMAELLYYAMSFRSPRVVECSDGTSRIDI